MNGRFISFEGVEGCGKSTQISMLGERLEREGRSVVATREPGGTAWGARLRALLLERTEPPPDPMAELLLYAADRAQHLREIVLPALERGSIVLCDRYVDATLAYQGYGRGLDVEAIRALHRLAPLDRLPDRTLWLDLDPREALERARRRNRDRGGPADDRFEAEPDEFHRRVRQGYARIADEQPDRVVRVDASGGVDAVAARVVAALDGVLGAIEGGR